MDMIKRVKRFKRILEQERGSFNYALTMLANRPEELKEAFLKASKTKSIDDLSNLIEKTQLLRAMAEALSEKCLIALKVVSMIDDSTMTLLQDNPKVGVEFTKYMKDFADEVTKGQDVKD